MYTAVNVCIVIDVIMFFKYNEIFLTFYNEIIYYVQI